MEVRKRADAWVAASGESDDLGMAAGGISPSGGDMQIGRDVSHWET